MTRYGLIGFPLGHSFSRKYFTEKFRAEAIHDHSYELFPIERITMLPGLLKNNPDLRGLNVTIPYKKDVLTYLDDVSRLPMGLNACNCIRISNNQLIGFNTDVTGFRVSIQPLLKSYHTHALILGNGGATAAVKFALQELNLSYAVVSRNPKQGADFVYQGLDKEVMSRYTVIINTTPLGTYPDTSLFPDIPYHLVTDKHLLYDLVYNPEITVFMKKGSDHGAVVKNGYDMLVIQAEESWKIWNNA
jgi:shikimate dehydrogenase